MYDLYSRAAYDGARTVYNLRQSLAKYKENNLDKKNGTELIYN